MKIERDGIIYKFTKLVPMSRLFGGKIGIEYREVPKDPYDIRIEEGIKAGKSPPEEPPIELAQNE